MRSIQMFNHVKALYSNFCFYCRSDEKFRKTLTETVPGADSVLKVVLQEEDNVLQKATQSINKATEKVTDLTNTVTGYFGGSTVEPQKPATAAPVSPVKKPSQSTVAAPPLPTISEPTPSKPSPTKTSPTKSVPVATPNNFEELNIAVDAAAKTAVTQYNNAIKVLKA